MNKLIIIGIAIAAIASVMIVNFPALIAQYAPSDKPSPEVIEECKQLGIPVFMCTENQILVKKRTIAAQESNLVPYVPACEPSDTECRITMLETEVKLLKERVSSLEPQQSFVLSDAKIVVADSGNKISFTVKNTGDVVLTVNSAKVRGWAVPDFQPLTLQPSESKFVEYNIPQDILTKSEIGAAVSLTVIAGQLTTVQSVAVTSE
ncbi:MAG: hypothetical protein HMLIMOIP_000034 [Candidatus Nitrosomirales archaeon]|jgi:hypothetical protein